MALDKTFYKLRINLFKAFIFYFPKSLIPEEKKELLTEKKYAVYFNNVILIDRTGLDYELKDKPSYQEILIKQSILETNMFKLLDYSQRLKQYQFEVFINKYMEHLIFFVYVSKWMNTNMLLYIKNHSDEIKNSFQLQYDIFQNHSDQVHSDILSKYKIVPNVKTDTIELIKNGFKDWEVFISEKQKRIEEEGSDVKEEVIPKNASREKKQVLLTEKEADEYLLKTVFKIKQQS